MRKQLIAIMVFMTTLACSAAYAAPATTGSVDVRNIITVSQFSETGLNKLSPAQLQAFNTWLNQFLDSSEAVAVASGSSAADIRNYMNVNAYNQSGLENLSPAELGALNAWFGQYLKAGAKTSAAPRAATPVSVPPPPSAAPAPVSGSGNFGLDSMPPEQNAQAPDRIESHIVGAFNGWNGNTVFKLANGQVWQQAATGYYTNVRLENPKVVIKKLLFGYLLTLPGHGETVFVRRIK